MRRPSERRPRFGVYIALAVIFVVLRQDPWLAGDGRLLFGTLPADLAWQAGLSVLAAAMMAVLVRYDWPAELETLDEDDGRDEARVDRG